MQDLSLGRSTAVGFEAVWLLFQLQWSSAMLLPYSPRQQDMLMFTASITADKHSLNPAALMFWEAFKWNAPPTHPGLSNATHWSPAPHGFSSGLQEFGRKEHLWQAVALSWDMEVWASDNSSPNVSFLCKQILPVGPIQKCMKNHRRQISRSKPLCEREGWKDMKALACILTRLSPSSSIFPICPLLPFLFSHLSLRLTSFNLRYFLPVLLTVRNGAENRYRAQLMTTFPPSFLVQGFWTNNLVLRPLSRYFPPLHIPTACWGDVCLFVCLFGLLWFISSECFGFITAPKHEMNFLLLQTVCQLPSESAVINTTLLCFCAD